MKVNSVEKNGNKATVVVEIDKELMESNHRIEVSALIARAESAERERDAAIGHVHDAIFVTNHSCFYCTMENCDGCTNSTVKEHFKYRGIHPNKYLVKQKYEQDGGAE